MLLLTLPIASDEIFVSAKVVVISPETKLATSTCDTVVFAGVTALKETVCILSAGRDAASSTN